MRRAFLKILALCAVLLAAPAFGQPTGDELYEEMMARVGPYEHPELTAYLQGLMDDIIGVSEMAGEEFTFTLLDSSDLNAFATAGNYVYMNRGLLNYVSNEAQLVSILAHEVGHITQKHVSVMPAVAKGAEFLTFLAAALSGSPEVMEAGSAYAHSLLKGHGRDNELAADEAAARYMTLLGYDTEEMIAMLSTMKDLETMMKDRAAQRGAPRRTYHGLFASHPRNDMRLRSAVSKAEAYKSDTKRDSGEARYRELTEGMIWGENFKEKEQQPERYADKKLMVRFDYPDGWTHQAGDEPRSVIGQPADAAASLSMQPHPRTPQTAEEYLYNYLNISMLRNGREISPARLKGYSGILPGENGEPDKRIAVVYYKLNAYLFTGEVKERARFHEFDAKFQKAINTFRPISTREIVGQKPKSIHYVKATTRTTFDALGEYFDMDEFEIQDLRLINGYYPTGEPKPGEWIRVFRRE